MVVGHVLPTRRTAESSKVVAQRWHSVAKDLPHTIPRMQVVAKSMQEHCTRIRTSLLRVEIRACRSDHDLLNHFATPAQASLAAGANVLTTSYIPGSNFAIASACCRKGSGAGSARIAS